MQYTVNENIQFDYVIPPRLYFNNSSLRYHVEVYNASTGAKIFFSNPTVTAALPVSVENPDGVPGLARFSSVNLPEEGVYVINVYYANEDDLDAPNVTVVRVASKTIHRITPVSSVTA